MRLSRFGVLDLVLAAGFATAAFAQQFVPGAPPPPPPASYPPVAGLSLSQQLMTLTDQPAQHMGFSFSPDMLQMAQGVLEQQGMDAKRAAVALRGIEVDNYRFKQPAFYTPEAMGALLESYRTSGWKHLVNANQTPENTAQPLKTVTDMWLHFSGADVDGVTVLTRSSKTMNVVQVSCDLRPLDLLHFSGHFGIPKVDPSAVMVPAPSN